MSTSTETSSKLKWVRYKGNAIVEERTNPKHAWGLEFISNCRIDSTYEDGGKMVRTVVAVHSLGVHATKKAQQIQEKTMIAVIQMVCKILELDPDVVLKDYAARKKLSPAPVRTLLRFGAPGDYNNYITFSLPFEEGLMDEMVELFKGVMELFCANEYEPDQT